MSFVFFWTAVELICCYLILQTIEEGMVFPKPVVASSVRILIRKPSDANEVYLFALQIFACYEDIIAETGNCSWHQKPLHLGSPYIVIIIINRISTFLYIHSS